MSSSLKANKIFGHYYRHDYEVITSIEDSTCVWSGIHANNLRSVEVFSESVTLCGLNQVLDQCSSQFLVRTPESRIITGVPRKLTAVKFCDDSKLLVLSE